MKTFDPQIYKTKDGGYRISYFDPRTGRRCRPRAKTLKEAQVKKHELLIAFQAGNIPSVKKLYVGNLIEIYLTRFPNSKFKDNRKRFLEFYNDFSHHDIADVDHKTLRAWIDKTLQQDNLCEKTGNRMKAQLNHFFKWCMEERIIHETPLRLIRYSERGEQRRPHPVLSPPEVREVLDKSKDFEGGYLYKFLVVLTFTGARKSELLNLKWSDVDFGLGQITIRRTKNGDDRKLFPSTFLMAHLHQEMVSATCDYVFRHSSGKRLLESSLRGFADRFKQQYSFSKNWTMHSFRHAFAYAFKQRGGDTLHLQALLGHKTAKMTLDTYGKITAADLERTNPYDFEM